MTAFTVDSYKWLQQDSGDVSNKLLERISHQLASSSITSTSANSTAPALSIANITDTFVVDHTSVSVNVLWFISLTLSLLAALFAIAVQQWLRHHTRPLPNINIRQAVKLYKVRRDGMKKWLVPGIVSLLPVLLQIAVVFFLIGTLLLLHSLHHTVAAAFTVVAGVGVLLFLATALLPLADGHCAYKSPLVPTVLILLQCLGSLVLAVLAYPCGLLLHRLLWSSVIGRLQTRFNYPCMGLFWVLDRWLRWLKSYVESFGAHIVVDLDGFWTYREMQILLGAREEDLCEALIEVMASIRDNVAFNRIKSRLEEFKIGPRIHKSFHVISSSMGFGHISDWSIYDYKDVDSKAMWLLLVTKLPTAVAHYTSSWQARTLLHALWYHTGWQWQACGSVLLTSWASGQFSGLRKSFCRLLWVIVNDQIGSDTTLYYYEGHAIVPLILLQHCHDYSMSVDGE